MPSALSGLRQKPAPESATIAAVPGDGAGPALVAEACRVVDAAVAKAYGGRRSIEWIESAIPPPELPEMPPVPPEVVDLVKTEGVALCGPSGASEGRRAPTIALRQAADLYADVRVLPNGVVLVADAREGEAFPLELPPGEGATADVLAALESRIPESFRALRFVPSDRADAYRRFKALPLETRAEAGVSIALVTRPEVQRLVTTALVLAKQLKKTRITVVHDTLHRPGTDGAFVEWAYRVAEEELGSEQLFSFREYARIANRGAPAAAEAEREAAAANGVPMLEDVELREVLRRGTLDGYEVVLATGRCAAALADAAAAWAQARPVVTALNVDAGRALFEAPGFDAEDGSAAHLDGLVAASAEMLRFLAWDDAADKLAGAAAKAAGKRAGEAKAYADAVIAAL